MWRKSVPIKLHVCVDCGVDLSGTHPRTKRCGNCRRINFNRRVNEYRRTHKEQCRKSDAKWKRKNRKHFLEYLREYASRRRGDQLMVDELVSLLRSNDGIIHRSYLREVVKSNGMLTGSALHYATKMGVVRVEGDFIKLIATPLLCAVDGFYEEKLSKVKGEIHPIVDFDKSYHPSTIRMLKREGAYDTWRKAKEVV